MSRASELQAMTGAELRRAFASGHGFDPSLLDDTEYKGVSLGLPRAIEKLSWKKFSKVFHRDPERGVLRGWNVRLEQNALDEPCVPLLRGGRPVTFGHYVVVDPGERKMPVPGRPRVLLDYGLGENGAWDATRFVRDPLVSVNEDDVELLLGCMYLEIGPLRVPTPSFFTLERQGPLSHRIQPPGRVTS